METEENRQTTPEKRPRALRKLPPLGGGAGVAPDAVPSSPPQDSKRPEEAVSPAPSKDERPLAASGAAGAPPRRPAARRSLKELTSLPPPGKDAPSPEDASLLAFLEAGEGAKPREEAIPSRKTLRRRKLRIACNVAIGVFSALFLCFAVKFGVDLYQNIKGEKILQAQRDKYRPSQTEGSMGGPLRPSADSGDSSDRKDPSKLPAAGENASIIELQQHYPDVCGWITLDGTGVDNLYVQGEDYDSYLRRDLSGEYVVQGTIFLEPQSPRDFSSFNTIMYGHNMKNGTMFGDLDNFEETDYWQTHTSGKIYLADRTYGLQIFALLVVKNDDPVIYDPDAGTLGERERFLSYIRQNARQYRDIGAGVDDTFLTMSTCAYEFDGARYILVARLMTYE